MPAISQWDAVVREIQFETGLPDDAFRETDQDVLVVTGMGMDGDLTRREREGIDKVISERPGLVAWARDGAYHIEAQDDGVDITGGL